MSEQHGCTEVQCQRVLLLCQTAIQKEQNDILQGMRGYLGIIRTKATYIESRMMNVWMNDHECKRLLEESTADHQVILDDTKWYMEKEEAATKVISEKMNGENQLEACATILNLIKSLHEKQWTIYKLRGVMNMFIKRGSIIKKRMTACLRSNEGIPEDCIKDKQNNDKNIQDQSIKIQDEVEAMKQWKMNSMDNLPEDIKEKIKKIRQDIKQVYVQMTTDAIKKAEQEPEKDDDEEVISISAEDAMMEDVDGWVEPVIKKIRH